MKTARARALPVLALCIVSCAAPDDGPVPAAPGPLSQAFAASAREADVAEPLLYAIAQIEDGFDEPMLRHADPHAEAPQAGPLHLRHAAFDSLAQAARLANVSELALREDTVLALAAGSKLLAASLERHDARVPHAAASAQVHWAGVKAALAEWSGYADQWHRNDYAARVLGVLARGGEVQNRFGEVLRFAPMAVPPALLLAEPKPVSLLAFVPEYPGAEAFPMNPNVPGKYMLGRDGYEIATLIIHDTEGGWEGSVATFQNEGSTSVHYLVGKDGRIAQFTYEADTAYHAGNRIYNRKAIGIEHVGFADQEFPETQYAKSAELVSALAAKYAIPSDRSHIIGHDQVPSSVQPNYVQVDGPPCMLSPKECQRIWYYGGSSGHTDPGIWQWGPYMARLGGVAKCNDLPSTLTCDSTRNYAMSCADGITVDVRRCASPCTSTPAGDGGDAGAPLVTCEPIPDPPLEPPAPRTDAGPPPGVGQDAEPPPPPPPSQTGDLDNDLNRYDAPEARPATASEASGCSVSATPGSGTSVKSLLLLGLVAGVSRARSARRSRRICA